MGNSRSKWEKIDEEKEKERVKDKRNGSIQIVINELYAYQNKWEKAYRSE